MVIGMIGMIGVIGSGKDHRSDLLVKEGYEKISISDSVREVCWRLLNWSPNDDITYEEFKKSKVEISVIKKFSNIGLSTTWGQRKEFTGRDLLISIGDGFKEIFHEDIWIDKTISKIDKLSNKNVVISDVRYMNEVKKLKQNFKCKFIFCNYKSNKYRVDESLKSEQLAISLMNNFNDGDEIEFNNKAPRYIL